MINSLLHIDTTLLSLVAQYGVLTYFILFAIIFAETGLVVTPFLPGDSLLFAAGSIAARPEGPFKIQALLLLLMLASIFGNKINYLIGRFLGERLFTSNYNWLFNKRYLQDGHLFYAKHGGKAIVFARFIPIVRTFVPFIAGMSNMNMARFSFYNIFSAVLWVGALVGAGYCFGTLPFVKNHLSFVIYGIVILSLSPLIASLFFKLRTVLRHGYA